MPIVLGNDEFIAIIMYMIGSLLSITAKKNVSQRVEGFNARRLGCNVVE